MLLIRYYSPAIVSCSREFFQFYKWETESKIGETESKIGETESKIGETESKMGGKKEKKVKEAKN